MAEVLIACGIASPIHFYKVQRRQEQNVPVASGDRAPRSTWRASDHGRPACARQSWMCDSASGRPPSDSAAWTRPPRKERRSRPRPRSPIRSTANATRCLFARRCCPRRARWHYLDRRTSSDDRRSAREDRKTIPTTPTRALDPEKNPSRSRRDCGVTRDPLSRRLPDIWSTKEFVECAKCFFFFAFSFFYFNPIDTTAPRMSEGYLKEFPWNLHNFSYRWSKLSLSRICKKCASWLSSIDYTRLAGIREISPKSALFRAKRRDIRHPLKCTCD